LCSNYLSIGAKLRLLAEVAVPPRRGAEMGEETVAAFAARRFGAEFAARVIDPMVGGIYAARASETSAAALFPGLTELERRHGSVTAGILYRRRRGGAMPGSRLFSWRDGIGALPRALARRLGGAVRTGVAVRRIERRAGAFRLDAGPSGCLDARAVVIATPPQVAAAMLDRVDGLAAAAAARIEAPPLAVVFLGYRRQDVAHPLDGLGFLAAEDERRTLNGVQFSSTMFPGRAPRGSVALTAYFGGARAPDVARAPVAELIHLADRELRELIGACGRPLLAKVRHWPIGLPQYRVGHRSRVATLREASLRHPGLFVTGNYFSGPSVAACVAQSLEITARVRQFLECRSDGSVDLPGEQQERQFIPVATETGLDWRPAAA